MLLALYVKTVLMVFSGKFDAGEKQRNPQLNYFYNELSRSIGIPRVSFPEALHSG
jgi:hypothetical protein